MTLTQINRAGLDADALDRVFTIGAYGSSAYTFQGEGLNGTVNNPTLYLTRGKTYRFENGSGGHPIRIQSTSGASGTAYNTGVTNNAGSGTVIVEVQHDAPDVLYYQCTSHAAMNGTLYITGALADGGVTTAKLANDAVTQAKIAANAVDTTELAVGAVTHDQLADNTVDTDHLQNSAVTTSKIAAGAVNTAELANNAVTNAKLGSNAVTSGNVANDAVTEAGLSDHSSDNSLRAVGTNHIKDEAVTLAKLPHGTSSNNGKFLRANNGADPSFETIPPAAITSIASDGANRVLTSDGDGTATAEGSLNFTGDRLLINTSTTDPYGNRSLTVAAGTSGGNTTTAIEVRSPTNGDGRIIFTDSTSSSDTGSYKGQIMYDQNNDFMQFSVNGASEAMRIVSNKEVGINLTNPEAYGANGHGYAGLTVEAPSGNYSGITIRSTYNGAGMLAFADGSGTNAERMNGFVSCDHVNKRLNIGLDGNTVARFTTHGFHPNPADYAAANALDDYEEGTWTPAFDAPDQSSTTFAHNRQHGYYTKIGNIVHVTCYLQGYVASNEGGGSNDGIVITGLPFTVAPLPATYNIRHAASFAIGSRYRVICDDLLCHAFGNSTVAKLWEPSSGNTMGQLKSNDITPRSGTNEIYFAGCYRVA